MDFKINYDKHIINCSLIVDTRYKEYKLQFTSEDWRFLSCDFICDLVPVSILNFKLNKFGMEFDHLHRNNKTMTEVNKLINDVSVFIDSWVINNNQKIKNILEREINDMIYFRLIGFKQNNKDTYKDVLILKRLLK